jgi:L-amino acid N-acyltransferase YncA
MRAGIDAVHMRTEPMTDRHAGAVLAIYQAGMDDGNATFETTAPIWPDFRAALWWSGCQAPEDNPTRVKSGLAYEEWRHDASDFGNRGGRHAARPTGIS